MAFLREVIVVLNWCLSLTNCVSLTVRTCVVWVGGVCGGVGAGRCGVCSVGVGVVCGVCSVDVVCRVCRVGGWVGV
jgi:hypothetical protein